MIGVHGGISKPVPPNRYTSVQKENSQTTNDDVYTSEHDDDDDGDINRRRMTHTGLLCIYTTYITQVVGTQIGVDHIRVLSCERFVQEQ